MADCGLRAPRPAAVARRDLAGDAAVVAPLQAPAAATLRLYLHEMALRVPDLRRHSVRVVGLALRIGCALREMAGQPLIDSGSPLLAGLFHDIGKLALPGVLLQTAEPRTPAEWALLRLHPEVGAASLTPTLGLGALQPLVRFHHEHWDGPGYPCGLAGAAIPCGARILAVADAWDTIRTPRLYQPARPVTVAAAELIQGAGRQFDPVVVQGALTAVGYPVRGGYLWPARQQLRAAGKGGTRSW